MVNRHTATLISSIFVLGLLAAWQALSVDSWELSIHSIQQLLTKMLGTSTTEMTWQETVITEIRFPRIFLAIGVGASLAIAGALMQVLFSNPLAEPYITGVSSGAVLVVVLLLFLGIESQASLGVSGFVGACFAQGVILFLCRGRDKETYRLLLMGIGVSALLQAIAMFLLLQADLPQMRSILFWLMGSFAYKSWSTALIILLASTIVIVASVLLSHSLDKLSLGEHKAFHLGLNVRRMRTLLFILSSTLVGVVVATCGMIGFVGLVAPHLARSLVGINHKRLLPLAAVWGALFTLTADSLLHALFPDQEMPVGIMTSLIGSCFLLYLLSKSKYVWRS